MSHTMFKWHDETLTLGDIAAEVEAKLMLTPTGAVVNIFREHDKEDLLEQIVPMLSIGNQRAIEAVLMMQVSEIYW